MRKLREYHRPEDLREALRLLARAGIRSIPIAGGTQVLAESRADIEAVIDLAALPLNYISRDQDCLRLGSTTRLSTICDSSEINAFAGGVLVQAARRTGTSLLRNQGTFGGALLAQRNTNELGAVLLVLEAEVLLSRLDAHMTLPLSDIFENRGSIEGSILTEVRVPAPAPDACCSCHRVSSTPSGPSILTVAALCRVASGRIMECRISVAGAGPSPARLRDLEDSLKGMSAAAPVVSAAAEKATRSLELQDDKIASAEYRRSILPVLFRRAVIGDREAGLRCSQVL